MRYKYFIFGGRRRDRPDDTATAQELDLIVIHLNANGGNLDHSSVIIQFTSPPPEVLAQMEAAGIEMPNLDFSQPRTNSSQYCLTAEDIANREPFGGDEDMDDNCTQQNFVRDNNGMSMDLVCTGDMNGTGWLEDVFDSATHFTGTMQGRPANMTNTMEGNWVSGDCGNVAP
jgi:hypothetical protein